MHTCAIFDCIVARAAFSRAEKEKVNGLFGDFFVSLNIFNKNR